MTMADNTSDKSSGSKRERIDTPTGPRYVERDKEGKFKDVQDAGRSQSQDRQRTAEHQSEPGRGHKGDRE
jgi:hypothetical protein